MNGITAWMEKYLVPVAAKIGSQKHLVALRDSFIGMLPATLAGALAAMISAIVTTFPSAIQQMMLGATAFSKLAPEKVWTLANTPIIGDLNNISALVNQGTLTVIGLIFAISWGYNLARAYGVNDLAGGIVSVATLFAGLPNQMGKFTAALGTGKAGVAATDKLNGVLGDQGLAAWKPLFASAHLDAGAYFTVIIMGALAVIIYAKLMLADITIKMPESVPPAVAKAFLAIIPTIAALYIVGLIYYIIGKLTNDSVINLITHYIAEPFQILSQNIFSVLIVTLFVSVFWFFGLHGPNVLAPVLDGIFNINEPVLFGLPVVLNAIFFIPFAVAPLISVIIAYTATALHLVDPVVNAVPWVTPPIMNAFMATGFDWRAIVLTIINLIITFVIWVPFVIAANKLEETELD
ncbi:PTS sugar transporter subunit IIC [Lactococcus lactis]|uniref:PTS sugar transporter subunit IIC n=1 Tax=Lactococcus lactis TaxID=1358 RepID=UPI0021A7D42D|nr:PTS transporter subunit EIIC [Lactococcus lactis]MCT3108359.1 PTS sugar transporter subunit IIC [Lactococcus lactis]